MFSRRTEVSPNIKFLVRPQIEELSETKALRVIFIIAQIVFSLDYGFIKGKSTKFRLLIKFTVLLQAIMLSVYLLYTWLPLSKSWFMLDAVVYLAFVIVTLSCKYTYSDFQADMRAFDKEIQADSASYRLEIKIVAMMAAMVAVTAGIFYIYEAYLPDSAPLNFTTVLAYPIMLHSADFVRVTFVYLFCSSYWRISKFITFVKSESADVTACQFLYKNIADVTEKAKANYNFVFVFTLLVNSIYVTATLFYPFATNSVKTRSLSNLIVDLMQVIKNLITMFAPTFTAGLLAAEVEKLVLALRDKMLVTKDEKTRNDIRRFINYIEARPMKFTICNIIPLDWNLPIIVINLAITYLIVMIQFTYKY